MRNRVGIVLVLLLGGSPAFGWGYMGHHMIGEVAAENFPSDMPAFLRGELAVMQIGTLSQEPDISRNAGQPHDADLDPGHFLDVSDDGTILEGPKLSALPATRKDYGIALRAINDDEYHAGFLPYNILDGYQQLVHDFAELRAYEGSLRHAAQFHVDAEGRKTLARLIALRQMLALRDLGYWAHFVEDASQPMHVSVHYNGWGNFPNPQGFTATPGLHSRFEADFVTANIKDADIAALMQPYHHCSDALQVCVQNYIAATASHTIHLFELDKAGAFDPAKPTPQSKAFTAQRLADGAMMLRDMAVDAWRASADETLGFKVKVPVADYENGKATMVLQSKD